MITTVTIMITTVTTKRNGIRRFSRSDEGAKGE